MIYERKVKNYFKCTDYMAKNEGFKIQFEVYTSLCSMKCKSEKTLLNVAKEILSCVSGLTYFVNSTPTQLIKKIRVYLYNFLKLNNLYGKQFREYITLKNSLIKILMKLKEYTNE